MSSTHLGVSQPGLATKIAHFTLKLMLLSANYLIDISSCQLSSGIRIEMQTMLKKRRSNSRSLVKPMRFSPILPVRPSTMLVEANTAFRRLQASMVILGRMSLRSIPLRPAVLICPTDTPPLEKSTAACLAPPHPLPKTPQKMATRLIQPFSV